MSSLTYLSLSNNNISDISCLETTTGLTAIWLSNNPLNWEACQTYIPIIRSNNPGIYISHSGCEDPLVFHLTLSSSSGGSISTPGEGSFGPYDWSTPVNLVAVAEEGYRFVNWTGNTETINSSDAFETTLIMEGDYTIQANFEVQPEPPNVETNQAYDITETSANLVGYSYTQCTNYCLARFCYYTDENNKIYTE